MTATQQHRSPHTAMALSPLDKLHMRYQQHFQHNLAPYRLLRRLMLPTTRKPGSSSSTTTTTSCCQPFYQQPPYVIFKAPTAGLRSCHDTFLSPRIPAFHVQDGVPTARHRFARTHCTYHDLYHAAQLQLYGPPCIIWACTLPSLKDLPTPPCQPKNDLIHMHSATALDLPTTITMGFIQRA